MPSQYSPLYIAPHAGEDVDRITPLYPAHDNLHLQPDSNEKITGTFAVVDRRVWITVDDTWW